MERSERVYRLLVRLLLPRRVRPDAEAELVEVFRALRRRAAARGPLARIALWVRLSADLAWTGLAERAAGHGGRAVWMWTRMRMMPLTTAAAAVRTIHRRPYERLVEGLTLTLGVAATAVVMILVREVLLRPLPYEDPETLVRLVEMDEDGRTWWPSRLNFEEWRSAAGFTRGLVAATVPEPRPVLVGPRAVRARVAEFSAGFFPLLGARFRLGRGAAPDEEGPAGPPVAIVSERFWTESLGGEPLEGATVLVGTERLPVVGVLERGFGFIGEGGGWDEPDVWIPLERNPDRGRRQSHGIHVVARIPPGVPLDRADAELDRMAAGVAAAAGEDTDAHSVATTSLGADLLGPARRPLRLLVVAAVAVLLVAVANLGCARLVHGLGRRRELAVRRALGAGRARVVTELLAEAVVVALPAALVGLGLAWAGLALAQNVDPAALPRMASAGLGPGAILAAVAIAVALALAAAALPAAVLSGEAVTRGVARTSQAGVSRRLRRVWDGVLALQVALTLILLTSSGIMIRGLLATLNEDVGYRSEGVLVAQVSLPESSYGTTEDRRRWVSAALERLRALPGASAVSLADVLPHVTQARIGGTTAPDGAEDQTGVWAGLRIVDPAYFDVLEIPRLTGDGPPSAPDGGVLVDRTIAERLLAPESVIGGRIRSALMGEPVRVVGVVGPVREWTLAFGRIGTLYADYRSVADLPGDLQLLVREREGAALGAAPVRDALRALDPNVPVEIASLESHLASTLGSRRLVLAVTAAFAALGLLLAAVGIYGVVAFVARRRLRESGVRVALGARPAQVSRSMLGIGLRPALVGTATGVAMSVLFGRVLQSVTAEAPAFDPVVAAFASLLVLAAAAGAGIVPARRAGRADPATVLREE
jgi:predicted permease